MWTWMGCWDVIWMCRDGTGRSGRRDVRGERALWVERACECRSRREMAGGA